MSTASRLRSSFCISELGVHLVENRDLLRGGDGRVGKEVAQLRAAIHVARKSFNCASSAAVSSLAAVTTSAKAWRSGKRRRPSSSALPCCRRSGPMNSAIRALVGLRREHQLLGGLLDGQVGGKVAQTAAGLGGGRARSPARRPPRCGALSSSMAALMRASSSCFPVPPAARMAAISSSSPASLASTALRRALASSVALRAVSRSCFRVWERLRKTLGRMRDQGNADGQNDDGEVDELEDARRGLDVEMKHLGQ